MEYLFSKLLMFSSFSVFIHFYRLGYISSSSSSSEFNFVSLIQIFDLVFEKATWKNFNHFTFPLSPFLVLFPFIFNYLNTELKVRSASFTIWNLTDLDKIWKEKCVFKHGCGCGYGYIGMGNGCSHVHLDFIPIVFAFSESYHPLSPPISSWPQLPF